LIDTHSHLLPWVDHGCPDLETCLDMAREAVASGVDTVLCTPHLPEWNGEHIREIREVAGKVRGALAEAGVPLRLVQGFEVDLGVAVTAGTGALLGLALEGGGKAILLEMPYTGWPVYLEQTIFRLAADGFRPVLAHPERNERVKKSSEPLLGCFRSGAMVQCTAASLTGEFGRGAVQAFRRLVSEGLVRLVGSDAHAYRREGWTLTPMLDVLRELVSDEDLKTLVDENPRRLLAGEPLLRVTADGPGSPGRRRFGRKVVR